jgi:hypothetical protein
VKRETAFGRGTGNGRGAPQASVESLEHLVALHGIGGSNVERETVFRPIANCQLPIAGFNEKRET